MTKTKAVIVPVTPFQQNCTLLWCEATKRAVEIDPGSDLPEVERAITRAGVSVDQIWLTHGHVDHVRGRTRMTYFYCSTLPKLAARSETGRSLRTRSNRRCR
jgi:hydroxyacylglutathione hydrolase